MRKFAVIFAILAMTSGSASANGWFAGGGYYGQPYAGGYAVNGVHGLWSSTGGFFGGAPAAGVIGAVTALGVAAAIVSESQRAAVPIAAPAPRTVCPYGYYPGVRPTYDAYGNFTGDTPTCYQ